MKPKALKIFTDPMQFLKFPTPLGSFSLGAAFSYGTTDFILLLLSFCAQVSLSIFTHITVERNKNGRHATDRRLSSDGEIRSVYRISDQNALNPRREEVSQALPYKFTNLNNCSR